MRHQNGFWRQVQSGDYKLTKRITPQEPILTFLQAFFEQENIKDPRGLKILDPCASGTSFQYMPYAKAFAEKYGAYVITQDKDPDSPADFKLDFMNTKFPEQNENPDIIIGRPPLAEARKFIERALYLVDTGGYVCFMLKNDFWASRERQSLFRWQMPKYCFVHSSRISFREDGRKDNKTYCHFVWQKDHKPEFTKTFHLT